MVQDTQPNPRASGLLIQIARGSGEVLAITDRKRVDHVHSSSVSRNTEPWHLEPKCCRRSPMGKHDTLGIRRTIGPTERSSGTHPVAVLGWLAAMVCVGDGPEAASSLLVGAKRGPAWQQQKSRP